MTHYKLKYFILGTFMQILKLVKHLEPLDVKSVRKYEIGLAAQEHFAFFGCYITNG
jgi:hypothetical protein